MTIRDMVQEDLQRVWEINAANVPEVGEADSNRLEFIAGECAAALVVDIDATVQGFCMVLPAGSTYDSVNYLWHVDRHPTAWYLDRVAFDASAQGQGLGSALYTEVERRLVAAGATGLTLEVNVDPPNEPSLGFHAKLGFVEVGRQMSHGIEVSLMHKSCG